MCEDGMPADEVLVKRLWEMLEVADLSVTTTSDIRRQLEAEMNVDLTSRKVLIRQQIGEFLQQKQEKEEDEEDEEVEENDEGNGESEVFEKQEIEEEEMDDVDDDKEESDLQANIKRAINESKPKRKRAAKEKAGSAPKRGGFHKICKLSAELAELIGKPESSRTEINKQLWSYIHEHKLQAPENRKLIRCDDAMRKVFQVDELDMFQMQKLLSKHLSNLETDANVEEEDQLPKAKKVKKGTISAGLKEFLGIDRAEANRQDVVKQLWAYIKEHDLKDPSNKRVILCDNKLEELFHCKSFLGIGGMSKLLKDHFLA